MEEFKPVYRILRRLEKMMDLEEPDSNWVSAEALSMTEPKWAGTLEMLIDMKYIAGVSIKRSGDGMLLEVSMANPRITLQGLTYLHSDPMMLKASELAKGIAEHKES